MTVRRHVCWGLGQKTAGLMGFGRSPVRVHRAGRRCTKVRDTRLWKFFVNGIDVTLFQIVMVIIGHTRLLASGKQPIKIYVIKILGKI